MNELSKREAEIHNLILAGLKTKEIANNLGLKTNTISTYKKIIMYKLGAKNIADLFINAFKYDLITID